MQNSLESINQSLENCLGNGMVRGFYFQAYFHLVERVGRESADKLERPLSGGEILYIADRVETYLKERVFKAEAGSLKAILD